MKLAILDGPAKGKELPIPSFPAVLGRSRDADVILPDDARMSRQHARLEQRADGRLWLEDLGSKAGTWLESVCVDEPTPIAANIVFRLADTTVVLLDDDAAPDMSMELLAAVGIDQEEAETDGASPFQTREMRTAEAADALAKASDETERLRTHLQVLSELSHTLSGNMEPHDLLEAAADGIFAAIPQARVLVLSRARDEALVPLTIRPFETRGRVVVSSTVVRRAVSARVGLMVADTAADEELMNRPSIVSESAGAVICAPLEAKARVHAVLYLDSPEANAFSEADLSLVSAIANQTSLALARHGAVEALDQVHGQLAEARARQQRLLDAVRVMGRT